MDNQVKRGKSTALVKTYRRSCGPTMYETQKRTEKGLSGPEKNGFLNVTVNTNPF